MASRWTDVERVDEGALPTMLAQAVIAGTSLTIGAIACSGFYLSMIGNVVALLPWVTVMVLIAVAFSYVVGFALLWCSEALTMRMKAPSSRGPMVSWDCSAMASGACSS